MAENVLPEEGEEPSRREQRRARKERNRSFLEFDRLLCQIVMPPNGATADEQNEAVRTAAHLAVRLGRQNPKDSADLGGEGGPLSLFARPFLFSIRK